MTIKKFMQALPDAELRAVVADILAWRDTGKLPSDRLEELDKRLAAAGMGQHDDLRQAESLVLREAASRYLALAPKAVNKNVTKEGIEVKSGQVWEDLDERLGGRRCTVLEVADGKAVMRRVDSTTGTKTKVSINRMHKGTTGWKLIS